MTKRKPVLYVLDTSVVIHDPNAWLAFEEHDVGIPLAVLEEMDGIKDRDDHSSGRRSAILEFNFHLMEFLESAKTKTDLKLPSARGTLRFLADKGGGGSSTRMFLNHDKPDHRILEAVELAVESGDFKRVVLVTKDRSLYIKANAAGLEAEDYHATYTEEITSKGGSTIRVKDGSIDKLFKEGRLEPEVMGIDEKNLFENEYLHLLGLAPDGQQSSALAFYRNGKIHVMPEVKKAFGLRPRNKQQRMALAAIMDPEISLVVITGGAGTGKTLVSLAGCLELTASNGSLLIARPLVPLSGKDRLGFLPGSQREKIFPYFAPMLDSIAHLTGGPTFFREDEFNRSDDDNDSKKMSPQARALQRMKAQRRINIEPLQHIRGRTLPGIVFMLDEGQNVTPHEIKTICTRMGEESKLVITADVFQIDEPHMDSRSCGVSYLIERMTGSRLMAHVDFTKGERSPLATEVSRRL